MKLIIIGLLALVVGQSALAAGVVAEISQVGESLHLEFKGQSQWDYNIDKKSDKNSTTFEIEIPHLSEPAMMALKKWQNPLVESLNVRHDGADGKDVISLKVKSKDLEAFDYLTDQPSRLIVDIYQSPAAKKATTKADAESQSDPKTDSGKKLSPKAELAKKVVAKDKGLPKKGERQPSSTDVLKIGDQGPDLVNPKKAEGEVLAANSGGKAEEKMSGIFDGGDPNFERFDIKDYEIKEDSIIASKENVYLDFPMLRLESDQLLKLNSTPPRYEITPKDNDENKMARLLLTLFENKRYNVFLKTVDWFYQKYPTSEYDEVIRFMWADTHFAMWQQKHEAPDFDMAMTRYRQALEKYPKSALMERTRMLMGFASMDRGDYLGTLRLFQQHIHDLPQSPNRDIARMAIANAYMKLGSFEDATATYQEIAKSASAKPYQVAATYFLGDVKFKSAEALEAKDRNGEYQKAIDEYKKAIQAFPENSNEFPNAYYNMASAFFKLDRPRESMHAYLDFLKKFPNHEYAGYAMTRVGELLDMMGADKARSVGAFLEAQFRYGDNPSSIVARLRLLASRMRIMKPKEVEKAVEDITELTKKSTLPRIDEFSKVLISDGFASRGEYENAINLLVKYYQAHPTTADTQLLNNRIVKNINSEIKSLVDVGNFIQALKVHNQYADNRLKNSDRIDTKYNVAMAFEQAGVNAEAEKLYRDTLNKMMAIKGTKEDKERNIFERLPPMDEVELRLANTEMQLGNSAQAYSHMTSIKHPENLTDIQQIERVQLGARLLEKRGDLTSASRYLVELIKTWKGIPTLVADPYLQLAELEQKSGKPEDAIQSLIKIDQMMADSQDRVPAYIHYRSLEQLGNLYLAQKQIPLALETYEKLLKRYEKSRPLSSIRYKVGGIYFSKGDLQKAADVWNGLKSDKNEVWYNLAQEQLKNSDWNNEYKKYIKRIPAMSEKN